MSTMEPYQPSTTPTSGRRLPTSERLAGGRAHTKRRWAIRSSSILMFAAVVLCLFVIWNRDRDTRKRFVDALTPVVDDLNDKIKELGLIPVSDPDAHDPPSVVRQSLESRRLILKYDSKNPLTHSARFKFANDDREFAIQSDTPVIVGYYTPQVQCLLHEDGRGVIIYDSRKKSCHAAWMSEREFARRWQEQRRQSDEFQASKRSRPVQLP